MNKMSEAWREWWAHTHGKNMPMGGYHPMEGSVYEAWVAAWDEANKQSQVEITYLKEQLMRANINDGAYKAAFLAGQMSRDGYKQGYADAMNWKTQNYLEHLPGREWVGLTKEEIKSLPNWWPSYEDSMALIELVKDVEAKLKEKNT